MDVALVGIVRDKFMTLGQEIPKVAKYVEGERPPTSKELALWDKAQTIAKRVNLLSYIVKLQYRNILITHQFAVDNQIVLNEPTLPDAEKRMLEALTEIEKLKDFMCEVNQLELGVRLSSSGEDLDIIDPSQTNLSFGWIIPVIIGSVLVAGIIARWAYLEIEITEVTDDYNGILDRADKSICGNDPNSDQCKNWKSQKQSSGYQKRETLIGSTRDAIKAVGSGAKTGLGVGLALAIPVALFMLFGKVK